MLRDVTVAITAIPPRIGPKLDRALASVWAQHHRPEQVIVSFDWERKGAGPNRTRGLMQATTTWVAFLDDDDEFMPHHLSRLLDVAEDTGADVIVPWFTVKGGIDPFPKNRAIGVPKEGGMPSFPVTVLARTRMAQLAEFPSRDAAKTRAGVGTPSEEYTYFLSLRNKGVTFKMIPDETWIYHHDGHNTSGLSDGW